MHNANTDERQERRDTDTVQYTKRDIDETDKSPNSDVQKGYVRLERNALPGGILGKDFKVPDEHLPWTPDHVTESRVDCVFQFLEEVLLPRIRKSEPLTSSELVAMATQFKLEFRGEHPNDFQGHFELLTAVELKLIEQQIYFKTLRGLDKEAQETADLVQRALRELKFLLDQYPEDLYPI